MQESVSVDLNGRLLSIETGKIGKQADGSVVVRMGDTLVLVTACWTKDPRDVDFLPLTVEYKEYQYAAGRIPRATMKATTASPHCELGMPRTEASDTPACNRIASSTSVG